MPYVVAVAGPVGGGKTTFVNALAQRLGDASAMFCDSYERMTSEPAAAIEQWIARGADYDELIMIGLAEDLDRLKRGETVIDPLRKVEIVPRKYLVLETNFGRAHTASGRHIDFLIWLDLPLEIALARKVRQFTTMFLTKYRPEDYRDCLQWLDEWLANYLRFIRNLLHMQRERVRPQADLVLDGEQSLETMIEQALASTATTSAPGTATPAAR